MGGAAPLFVPDIVRAAATRFPDRPAVIGGGRRITFREVDERASRAAAAMHAAGLLPGDRVALLAENEVEYLELQVACDRGGLVFVPLNFRCTAPELQYMLDDCTPRLLIAGARLGETASRLSIERHWHLGSAGPGASYDAVLRDAPLARHEAHRPGADLVVILYTSGTTGKPKGAMISRQALWARGWAAVIENDIRPGDVFANGLPMFHISAHTAWGVSMRGATLLFPGVPDPEALPRALAEFGATHLLVVPTIINMLTTEGHLGRVHLPAMRRVAYGGQSISPTVLTRALEQLPVGYSQFFGMSEAFYETSLRPEDHVVGSRKLASAGTDSVFMETRIVGSGGEDLPPGEKGEVWARGPSVMDGYWKNPAASAASLTDGWMHTGDVAWRDEDGYLYVADRVSDMIISGGENVYPREIEDALMACPGVLEVAVIGVPDERWGERVHAMMVPSPGVVLDVATLEKRLRERIAGYKVPKSWAIVETLPHNAIGKVLKRELRAQLKGRAGPGGRG